MLNVLWKNIVNSNYFLFISVFLIIVALSVFLKIKIYMPFVIASESIALKIISTNEPRFNLKVPIERVVLI